VSALPHQKPGNRENSPLGFLLSLFHKGLVLWRSASTHPGRRLSWGASSWIGYWLLGEFRGEHSAIWSTRLENQSCLRQGTAKELTDVCEHFHAICRPCRATVHEVHTPIRCTSMRYTPMRYTPVRYKQITSIPIRGIGFLPYKRWCSGPFVEI
jgi:hypothetical protein